MPWFEAQVALAGSLRLPLVVHSVRTHDEVAAVLRRSRPDVPVLVHGFSGSYQQGKALVDLGCFLGIGGVITHDRARKTRGAVSRLPAEAMVLETNAPDMPPAGVARGDNEPANLRQVLTALAELKGQGEERLAEQLAQNVGRLYGWPSI
jgi:TatD DNase family protein